MVSIFDFDLSDSSNENYKKNLLKSALGLKSNYNDTIPAIAFINIMDNNASSFAISNYKSNKMVGKLSSLFLFLSLFNHSCEPNVELIPIDDKITFIIVKPIKKGEQLFLCYNRFLTMKSREDRQKFLLEKFQFNCNYIKRERNFPGLSHSNVDPEDFKNFYESIKNL
ncbi:hypothetical protein PVAND_001990 [Polypedilum vanderplanki]|uniref:SET domain-containing protein n=1 Tax=Polypedilum vanderplanki TaxID=319348 RepID=A0A9J6BQ03_POLVA|nr:hypothetical protein PVAND_001990 [Polypedilum vanderplanki]